MKNHFRCFRTEINRGLNYGRIDVLGIRDVGGDFSGAFETIAVEVKRGSRFVNAAGQAVGYRVYAHRVYLADARETPFTREELLIASNLGIGLVQIRGTKCREVLSSPLYEPITQLQFRLFDKLQLGVCTICNCLFELGDSETSTWRHVCIEDVQRAIKQQKGLLYGLREVEKRRSKLGLGRNTSYIETRRFICPDCVSLVLGPLHDKAD
ncbi:MAG: hypothetical protein U0792_01095 [Gemmataceae bacterium]